MDRKKVKERVVKLRKLLEYHRTLYHTFDSPEISDAAFDGLRNELETLEKKFPEFSSLKSPTQKVGGKILDKFPKVKHEEPMLSFFDAFSKEEMHEWQERLENYLGVSLSAPRGSTPLFYCELKIDGLAIELVYESGILRSGSTRGDGVTGEDITQNIKMIKDIPQQLTQLGKWKIPKHLVVRGEVFISRKELMRINREQEKKKLKPYANTRNLAAGSLRQLDSSVTASRKLNSFQYDIVGDIGQKTHEEEHKILASWGFLVNPHDRSVRDIKEICSFRDAWEKKRERLPYEIDGVVALLNENDLFKRAGAVGKASRAAVAYKFSPRQATTTVEDIKIQVGRTGTLTPVAILCPVEVSGVKISHSTLHNFDEIARLDVRIGDTVIVTRSGDVIPKIIKVLKELRTGKERYLALPKKCPADSSPVKKEGVFLRCVNPSCGAKNRNSVLHFVSRNAFDIKGLGDKIVDRFFDEGLISDAVDIFTLREGDITGLERFGEKSAHNLIEAIRGAKRISLGRFLYALGILHVGEETAQLLEKKFASQRQPPTILNVKNFFLKASLEDLQDIHDVGEKVAASIKSWFSNEKNQKLLSRFSEEGIELFLEKGARGKFSGRYFVLTGTLDAMPRPQAKERIKKLGGHTQNDITEKTSVLIVGKDPGSKLTHAKERGVEIWDEKKFLKEIA